MRLNPAAFDRFLTHMGQQTRWRRSFACACLNAASGQPDPKHQLCGGKGRLWNPPVDTVVGVASQKVQITWANLGMYEAGDLVLSVQQASPVWDAGQYDRLLMLNASTSFSQPLTRGAPSERLIFSVKRVTRCFWLGPAPARQIVEGGIPVVSADGLLSWPNGGEPPAGTVYSLTGEKFDEYFILMDMPGNRNQHSGSRLPKRIVARKFDLFNR